jgi:4-diphosphocytidyl-2-C-methyl-D-erythritol kinase
MWELDSFAKINIFLEITEKSGDLHKLHSLFCKIDLADNITIKPFSQLKVTYNNQKITNDILFKTITVLRKHFPKINTNFLINVNKNIPIGAGLGGASSNAATVIKFLLKENFIEIPHTELLKIGKEVGSDVPFFLCNGPMILHGTGAELNKPNFKIPQIYCVISYPNFILLTKDVFARISPPYTKFKAVINFEDALIRNNEMQTTANLITNGLINKTLTHLFHPKALVTKMSGSGVSCFSLFRKKEEAIQCFHALQKHNNTQVFLTQILLDN